MDSIKQAKKILNQQSVSAFEIIPLSTPLSFEHYQTWIENGFQADMNYMAKNADVRETPGQEFKQMRSIIVFEQDYFTNKTGTPSPFPHLKIARYAQDQDYHLWFRERLNALIDDLKKQFPDESFVAFTDAVPLLERDHARQGGLGWVGKNTCLIHPKRGSFFFIGEILTSLVSTETPELVPDFCGSCTACMDQCPTQAFVEPRVLDANKCISFWNIESKTTPPTNLREKMGDWFFGCDVCQTVCPWNIKVHRLKDSVKTTIDEEKQQEELCFILQNSNKKLLKITRDTPLSRAGGRGLKRNALIVIGNKKYSKLKPIVETYRDHPYLSELANWTIEQLESST